MAALLVAIAILSVMMLVALPTWRHQAQREKEAELIFRGEQYARAIGLYQRKLAGALPASIDILVEQKFLRKKYKDPITGDDFQPVFANSPAVGGQQPGSESRLAGAAGGIVGVVSKSTAQSIRLYNGRDRHDQWVFMYMAASPQGGPAMGPGQPGAPVPMPPGGRGRGRGF